MSLWPFNGWIKEPVKKKVDKYEFDNLGEFVNIIVRRHENKDIFLIRAAGFRRAVLEFAFM